MLPWVGYARIIGSIPTKSEKDFGGAESLILWFRKESKFYGVGDIIGLVELDQIAAINSDIPGKFPFQADLQRKCPVVKGWILAIKQAAGNDEIIMTGKNLRIGEANIEFRN